MSKIDLENKLKLLQKKQTKISFRMRDLMRMNQNRTTVEYEELKNRVAKEGIDSVLGLTGNAEADLALAKNRGYESAAAYKAAFEEALNIEWKVPSGLADNIADKLTVGAAEKINKTYEEMGSEGGNAYLGALKQISDSIDWDSLTPEEQSEAWTEIANIDWSNWDAGKNAVQILRLQKAGGKVMDISDFLKGNKLELGEVLG